MTLFDPTIAWCFAISIALLLALSAMHKLSETGKFFQIVRNFRIVPAWAAVYVGAAAIAAEMAIAAALVTPASQAVAGIAAALLFTSYGFAIGINIARGRIAIDCGCHFGGSPDSSGLTWRLLVRNGVLAAAAFALAAPRSVRQIGPLDVAWIIIFVAAAAALYVAFDALSANSARARAEGGAR